MEYDIEILNMDFKKKEGNECIIAKYKYNGQIDNIAFEKLDDRVIIYTDKFATTEDVDQNFISAIIDKCLTQSSKFFRK